MRTFALWIVRIVGGIIVVVALILAVLGLRFTSQATRKHEVADVALTIPSDSASIARGKDLLVVFTCEGCHGPDLAGGTIFDVAPVGRVATPNITRAGVTKGFTPSDWNRAIRHGVAPGGRGLLVMPAYLFAHLADSDLGAIVAYVNSVPPVEKVNPSCEIRPGGWVLAAMTPGGLIAADHIDHAAPHPATVAVGVTAEYGGYLAHACQECHGPVLSGGKSAEPGALPAPNLTPSPDGHLARWSQDQFIHTLRQGVTPEGKALSAYMPWTSFRRMTDDELTAVWLYLHGLPPRASTAPKAG